MYMVQNDLSEEDVLEKGGSLDFPDSVVELFQGYLGQPYQGFPKDLQDVILKGREAITNRPGENMHDVDFKSLQEELYKEVDRQITSHDLLSYALYPKVYMDFERFRQQFGDVTVLDTATFFYGLRLGEEIEVEIEQGKTLIVKLISISKPQDNGTRIVYFELNGQPREVNIKDQNVAASVMERPKVDKKNANQIGASMPGTVIKTLVVDGEKVKKGDHLMITEAMKMETTVQAPFDGEVKSIHVADGDAIATGDLLIEFSS